MTLRYLLDTNVISEPLRPAPHPGVLARLQQHSGTIAIAAVVWHELLFGSARLPTSARRTMIERYLHQVVVATLPILPYDTRAADWHAQERARLAALGRIPPFADSQIAAIAQTNQLVLVTFNTADYTDFSGLVVEDWRF
ncbi:MAG: type II toxin-antitoxin system VapC family toxin [Roseiflexaceae bacterium]|nr:type II toxin-antitoxin system VapC family toxin [Roseiflexaceae bacterium]